MRSIVFLASSEGGNFKFLFCAIQQEMLKDCKLTLVADRECGALDFARQNNIDNYLVSYGSSDGVELVKILDDVSPDLIITTWHKILQPNIVNLYRGRMINLHYSLLPSFSGVIGMETVRRAYERGCKFIGPTCHYVDEGVDTGPVISQAVFLTNRDLGEAINLMFRVGCLLLLNTTISFLKNGCDMEHHIWMHDEVVFSPKLNFDPNKLEIGTWEMVRR